MTERLVLPLAGEVILMAYRATATPFAGGGSGDHVTGRQPAKPASIDRWDNEGGARSPRDVPPLSPARARLPTPVRKRQPHDTAAGCRIRAEADLLLASAAETDNGRGRFALSAATWATRGDLLQRLEASHAARLAGRTIPCPG